MAGRLTQRRGRDFWDRQVEARRIIDSSGGGVCSVSSRTSEAEEIIHWRTAESLAERMPGTYRMTHVGGGRIIVNIRKARTN